MVTDSRLDPVRRARRRAFVGATVGVAIDWYDGPGWPGAALLPARVRSIRVSTGA